MNKIKLRIIMVLFFALAFNAALFGVLYAEEIKRIARQEGDLQDFLARMREGDQARKAYYESVAKQKEELRQQMADSKKQYDELLAKQPELVAKQNQQVTKTTQEVVPVTTKQTVTTKPKSTKSTKSS